MHAAPPTIAEPQDCVFCGRPFAQGAGRWFVRGDAAWAPARGFAHTECMPWEKAAPPWRHLIAQLPKDLLALQTRTRAGSRLLRSIQKLHREWPLDARRRVQLVEELIAVWERR
jgi:hypothetical protein